jgi:hypothetical protein
MAGTITHLVIADQVYGRLPAYFRNQITNVALYYCGNLAPDAIMARKHYVRSMKRHTHFKDDIRTNDLHLPDQFKLYRKRLEEFARRFLTKENPEYALYFGYVVHMLADEVFILSVRDVHVKQLLAVGKDPQDPQNFRVFGEDVDQNDWRLVEEYPFSCDILKTIQAENGYEIQDMITAEELASSKAFIIEKNFLTPHTLRETKDFTYAENRAYIQEAVDTILSYLRSFCNEN